MLLENVSTPLTLHIRLNDMQMEFPVLPVIFTDFAGLFNGTNHFNSNLMQLDR